MPVGEDQRGFSYILLLITVAVISSASLWSIRVGSEAQRWQAEKELLKVGGEFSRALQSYRSTSQGGGVGPKELTELLLDPRTPFTKRHIRKIYSDPLSGQDNWGLVYAEDKRIVGIFSKSDERPMAQLEVRGANGVEHARSYRQWIFGAPAEWYEKQGISNPCYLRDRGC